jgi:hypothetical protein
VGIKTGQMFQPIRVAVCGRMNAPPLFGTLEALGKETSLAEVGQSGGGKLQVIGAFRRYEALPVQGRSREPLSWRPKLTTPRFSPGWKRRVCE